MQDMIRAHDTLLLTIICVCVCVSVCIYVCVIKEYMYLYTTVNTINRQEQQNSTEGNRTQSTAVAFT